MNLYPVAKFFLFRLSPENAHALSLKLLDIAHALGLSRLLFGRRVQAPVTVMGIEFPNAVGLAAGMDKDADHVDAFAGCGFGFVEVGTVTPRAQPGNPKPRLFRLISDQAIINRMGFNNKGVDHLVERVRASSRNCVIGINIGKNRDTPLQNAVDDYVAAFEKVYALADYVTINISSPNTPGLRDLQHGAELDRLLSTLKQQQQRLSATHGEYIPLLVKIAPDLSADEVQELADTLLRHRIDGVIATNTSNDRPPLHCTALAREQGGLSGLPIREKSDRVLQQLCTALQGRMPVIAVGGIMSAEDALRKIELGASLVQVYTGFIYKGPALISDIARRLLTR
jgi:dihydroorotate dehydrogenase